MRLEGKGDRAWVVGWTGYRWIVGPESPKDAETTVDSGSLTACRVVSSDKVGLKQGRFRVTAKPALALTS